MDHKNNYPTRGSNPRNVALSVFGVVTLTTQLHAKHPAGIYFTGPFYRLTTFFSVMLYGNCISDYSKASTLEHTVLHNTYLFCLVNLFKKTSKTLRAYQRYVRHHKVT